MGMRVTHGGSGVESREPLSQPQVQLGATSHQPRLVEPGFHTCNMAPRGNLIMNLEGTRCRASSEKLEEGGVFPYGAAVRLT